MPGGEGNAECGTLGDDDDVTSFQPFALFAAVVRIFMSEVFRCLRKKAVAEGIERPLLGGIAFLQRFGSTVNLNPHIHALLIDGAYVHENRVDRDTEPELTLHPLAPPTSREVEDVSARVCRRVLRLLERRGVADADGLTPREEHKPEEAIQEAAARLMPLLAHVDAEGRVHPVYDRATHPRAGEFRGFSTHASVYAPAGDKQARRRIVRYCTRPPFAQDQVRATRDGRIAFELRHPRSNGATHAVMSELGFVKKLCAIVPPPRQHQARYFGVLCSASRLRRFVVPAPLVTLPMPPLATLSVPLAPPSASRRTPWAALLARVYDVDALACPVCPSGRLKIIAAITEPSILRKILNHLALDDVPQPSTRRTHDAHWSDP